MFNAAEQQVSSTNTGSKLVDFINNEVNPQLAKFSKFQTSLGASESINNWLGRNAITAINLELAQDGAIRTNEIREWRFNMVTNYTFDQDSALKGWNVGGAMRWQDNIGIGRPLNALSEGGFAPDLDNTFFGPTETTIDAWAGFQKPITFAAQDIEWRVQLSVRNLLDETISSQFARILTVAFQ